jgi:hypothetical protein
VLLDAGADAPGIDQPSMRIVTGEEQRAEIRPCAFRIGPAHYHEFLALEALDLDPQTAIAGHLNRIGALRDNALKAHGAGFVVELPPVPDLVIAVLQR